jgi:hypothetical protein
MVSITPGGREGTYILVSASDSRRTDGVGSVKGSGSSLAEALTSCREALAESLAEG